MDGRIVHFFVSLHDQSIFCKNSKDYDTPVENIVIAHGNGPDPLPFSASVGKG